MGKRFVCEVVELDRDCELGEEGERAVVVALEDHHGAAMSFQTMTLVFPNRASHRKVNTGSDYRFLRSA